VFANSFFSQQLSLFFLLNLFPPVQGLALLGKCPVFHQAKRICVLPRNEVIRVELCGGPMTIATLPIEVFSLGDALPTALFLQSSF